ncbi:MAG TPA: DUF1571 domain-containing protein [Pirellulales bacterium]|jgi:hypothetical protein|nr:DUF1571 domain-containing protein [Pirellulales bacterium]
MDSLSRARCFKLFVAGLVASCPWVANGQEEQPDEPEAVARARACLKALDGVADYQCTLHKRERIKGKLGEHEAMTLRLRHEPLSVYVRYQVPKRLEGQEVLYVDGRNDGKMLAHPPGLKGKIVRTVPLKTTGRVAMEGNRYPITEVGLKRMAESWLKEYQRDAKLVRCDTRVLAGAKVGARICTCVEAERRQRHQEAPFQLTKLFIDDELGLPIRYEAYEWHPDSNGKPLLAEEYSYVDLQLDNGFTDADFDENNSKYGFR